jgi:hypothetical protein
MPTKAAVVRRAACPPAWAEFARTKTDRLGFWETRIVLEASL